MLAFVKTEALGNDFILIEEGDSRAQDWTTLAPAICDRRRGVGADGLILWKPGPEAFHLRIINSDGSEAESSGNGLRCLAAHLFGSGRSGGSRVRLQTISGLYTLEQTGRETYAADMGTPTLEPAAIPFETDEPLDQVVDHPLDVDGRRVRVTLSATGNPHCSVFLDAMDPGEIATLGPKLSTHPSFPKGTNVEFIRVRDRNEIEVAFWERGAGMTPASGTGSCGAVVASVLNGKTERTVRVHAENGELDVDWKEDGRLILTGAARVVAEGKYLL